MMSADDRPSSGRLRTAQRGDSAELLRCGGRGGDGGTRRPPRPGNHVHRDRHRGTKRRLERAHHGARSLCMLALTTAPCRSAYPRSPRRSARRSTAHHGASPLFPTGALGNPRRHPSRRPVHKASTRASRVRTPHRSNETLRPSEPNMALEPNMDLPPRMQVLTTTLLPRPPSPTELRPSAERRAERLRPSAGHGGRRHAAAGAGRRHPPPRAGAISLDCP